MPLFYLQEEEVWNVGVRMGGMQVLSEMGGGEMTLSVITTQMFLGLSGLTDVRAHPGKHETVGHSQFCFV